MHNDQLTRTTLRITRININTHETYTEKLDNETLELLGLRCETLHVKNLMQLLPKICSELLHVYPASHVYYETPLDKAFERDTLDSGYTLTLNAVDSTGTHNKYLLFNYIITIVSL